MSGMSFRLKLGTRLSRNSLGLHVDSVFGMKKRKRKPDLYKKNMSARSRCNCFIYMSLGNLVNAYFTVVKDTGKIVTLVQ